MNGKPLPIEEHVLIGLELCAMRERLCMLGIITSNTYGHTMGSSARYAACAIDRLRELLNEHIVATLPQAHAIVASRIYNCTEHLHYLREIDDAARIGYRILGINR